MKFLILLTCLATPALAEMPGIQFDQMPVGCKIYGTYGTGDEVIDVFVGRRSGGYIMKTYKGPEGRELIRTTTYDDNGLMTRKDWAGGQWETFDPASCNILPGDCSYTYRNGDGSELAYEGRTTVQGDQLRHRGGFVGQSKFPATVSTRGPYNLGEGFREGDTTFRVTKYENCGL